MPIPIDSNDNDCDLQSTLELKLQVTASIFVLVTGYTNQQGNVELLASLRTVRPQTVPPWGLDRIDQRQLPLNGKFSVQSGGRGVYAYVLDSGVRVTHSEFATTDGSRRAIFGTDVVDRLLYSVDSTGHGTHVAATIGGNTFGVAKEVTIISVRVLNRRGIGYTSRLVEGLAWALADIQAKKRHPALVSMSLSTPFSQALNEAVKSVTRGGVPVITAAGNSKVDSCSFSPASEISTITVAAMNPDDSHAEFSNYGECINIYAPGRNILSAWHTGDDAMRNRSGTSAACPHVAGTVAVLLGDNPLLKSAEVGSVIYSTATPVGFGSPAERKNESSLDDGSQFDPPSRLVYVRPLPSLSRVVPPEPGTMYIFAVFSISSNFGQARCDLDFRTLLEVEELAKRASSTQSESPTVTAVACCPGIESRGCIVNSKSGDTSLVFQLLTKDVYSSAVFRAWNTFCLSPGDQRGLEKTLGATVSLLHEPWVVDSRGYRYWAAPSLIETDSSPISTGQAVLIACMTCLVLVLVAVTIVLVMQRRRERALQQEQEEYDQKAADFARSQEHASNLTNLENGAALNARREGMKRVNTDLFGDVLKNISSSAALLTPRIFGGRTPRSRGGEAHTPRGEPATEEPSEATPGPSGVHKFSKRVGKGSPYSARRGHRMPGFSSFFGGLAVTPRGRARGELPTRAGESSRNEAEEEISEGQDHTAGLEPAPRDGGLSREEQSPDEDARKQRPDE